MQKETLEGDEKRNEDLGTGNEEQRKLMLEEVQEADQKRKNEHPGNGNQEE